jgi:hypothetical protein
MHQLHLLPTQRPQQHQQQEYQFLCLLLLLFVFAQVFFVGQEDLYLDQHHYSLCIGMCKHSL